VELSALKRQKPVHEEPASRFSVLFWHGQENMPALASRPCLRAGASHQHGASRPLNMSHFIGNAFHGLKSGIPSQKAIKDISR
jgi:hypothetical protein